MCLYGRGILEAENPRETRGVTLGDVLTLADVVGSSEACEVRRVSK